jgi:predicted CXXCH cytochrome family protein
MAPSFFLAINRESFPMRIKFLLTVITSAALLLAAGLASATVVGTKHDMTSGTQSKNYDNVDNTGGQVCVYCHTPHNATGKTFGPIWNRTNSSASYTMYGTTTSNTASESVPGTESLACLSCHDGTVAIDSIVNTPNPSNSWTSNSQVITGFALVGTDLSDDHPVSITYNEGLSSLDTKANALLDGVTLYDGGTKVECASCHSVHDDTLAPFLRVTPDNSDICTACHTR